MKVLLSFIVLAVSVLGTRGSGKISCSVSASPVTEGQFVSITCHFNQDVRGKNLRVYRIDLGDVNRNQAIVLRCTWNKSTDSHDCEIKKPGYELQHVSSDVRLVIPSVSKAHEGNYSCQVLGEKPDSSEPCTLRVNVTGFDTTCNAPPVTKGEPGEITWFLNKNLTEAKAEFAVIRQPFVANGKVTVVSDCFWSNSQLNCTSHDSYTIEVSKISSMLTLRIANSTEEQEGRYTCKVAYSPHGIETPCDFRLKEEQEDRDVCEVHNCHPQREKPCDFKPQAADGDGCPTAWTIFGLCLGSCIVASLIAIGIGVFILKRLGLEKRLRKICNPSAEESVPLRNSGSPRSTEARGEREDDENERLNQ